MIKKLGLTSLFSFISLANIAAAQATCSINGQNVPCDQFFNSFGGLLIGFMITMWVIGLIGFIFWLIMLIHAATKPIENKVVWILIIILTNIIGAIVYYFVVKRNFDKTAPTQNINTPNTPPAVPPQA